MPVKSATREFRLHPTALKGEAARAGEGSLSNSCVDPLTRRATPGIASENNHERGAIMPTYEMPTYRLTGKGIATGLTIHMYDNQTFCASTTGRAGRSRTAIG